MNPELQQLKDIHLPQAINRWPVAPGWIILFVILLTLSLYLAYRWHQQRLKKRTIQYALTMLNQLESLTAHNPDHVNIAAELSTLIRRTALGYFQREKIAGLSGEHWLIFLNESGHTTQFTEAAGRLLIDAPYRQQPTEDLLPLISLTKSWLKTISKQNRLPVEK